LLFLLWPVYEVALIAMVLTGLNRIMSVGYYLLMIEDASEENSVVSMNLFNIILVAAGLLTPLAGLFVMHWGVVRTEQAFLLIAAISMASQAIIRHFLLKETPTGKMVQHRIIGEGRFWRFSRFFAVYKQVHSTVKRDRVMLRAVIINALIYVYFSLGTTSSLLFAPFFIDFVKISTSQISLIGGIYSLGTVLSMVLVNPHLKRRNLYAYSVWSSLLSLFGFALLFFCPKGGLVFPLLAVVCISLSYGVLKTLADAVLAVETHGEHRAGVYAASYLLSSLVGIMFIKFTSMLYAHNPGWLLLICAILLLGVLLLSLQKQGGNGGIF